MKINIYTDGAAKGNPGPGGYGVVLMAGKALQGVVCWLQINN